MHYFALVLVPPETVDVEAEVYRLLGPFRMREEELPCPCQSEEQPGRCEQCEGEGTVVADSNPATQFDWMMIGGRFDGRVSSQPPERIERFAEILSRSIKKPESRDDGTVVVEVRDNEEWRRPLSRVREDLVEANTVPVSKLPPDLSCLIVITPVGCWHERGFLGRDAAPAYEEHWARRRQELLTAYGDCLAVGCDIHY